MKLGRNSPCHCGSGRKYKRCHLTADRRVPTSRPSIAASTPQAGIEEKGSLLGKPIMVTTDPATFTFDDLRRNLSRFNLTWTLRRVGEVSSALGSKQAMLIDGVPVTRHSLPVVAIAAIESSSDRNRTIPSVRNIAEAARIYTGLREPSRADGSDAFALLIRMAHQQFSEPNTYQSIARNWSLYGPTWRACKKARHLDIDLAVQTTTGLTLTQLMVLSLAYASKGNAGYWIPYDDLSGLTASLGIGPTEHKRFLDLVSGSYDEIRELAATCPSRKGYEQYRLNPLLVKPVVRPDTPPELGAEGVHLVPVPNFLARRVCDGIYHTLATAHDEGDRKNAFREAFGHVFQAYMGELLRAADGDAEVLGEWSYGPKKRRRSTPDWLLLDGPRLVVLEVKQSATTLNTRTFGNTCSLEDDLRRTLTHGARQLIDFRHDVFAGAPGLERLRNVKEVELLLVTHEPVPWGNWILRQTLSAHVPGAGDVHLTSIENFEDLQRYYWGESLFSLLRAKRLGSAGMKDWDFREWLLSLGDPKMDDHPVLATAFNEFQRTWAPPSAA